MLMKFLFASTLLALVLAFPTEIPDMVTSYSDDITASPTDFNTSSIVETTPQTNDFTRIYTEEATAETVVSTIIYIVATTAEPKDSTTAYIEETTAEPEDITNSYTEDSTLQVTGDPVDSLSGEHGSAEPTSAVTGEEFQESSTSGSGDLWSEYFESRTLPNEAYSTGTANESRTISTDLYTLNGTLEPSTSLNEESVTEEAGGSTSPEDNMETEDQPYYGA